MNNKNSNMTSRREITEERNRCSKEIHDGVAQNLTALGLNLQFCTNIIDKQPEKVKEVINNCLNLISESAKELKFTIFEPAALTNFGLINSFKKQIEHYQKKLNCSLSVKGKEKIYSPEVELFLWRIFSEILVHLSYSDNPAKDSLSPGNKINETQNRRSISLDILFDFSATMPFLLFMIKGWDIDNFHNSLRSSNKRLANLITNAEEKNFKIIVSRDNNITNIKINF